MKYFLYILQSLNKEHFYIGSTQDLQLRLTKHNNGSSFSTKPFRPWQIIYTEEFATKSEANKREHYLKSPAGYLEKKAIFNQHSL